MLHLRVVCPAEDTDAVLTLLRRDPGTAHLTVVRGAAVAPPGDLVQADVARESADGLLARLCDQGVDRRGGVTLEPLDTVLSDAADEAERASPGLGDDAVLWDEVVARTGDDARLTSTFLSFLVIAMLLAVVGVATDSPVTVVGAMVVGPEFGPLAALAVGLVLRRADLVRRAAVAVGVGFPVSMGIAVVAALVAEHTGLIPLDPFTDPNIQVDFIFEVGPLSLVVAMLAGAAGMLAITSAKSAALVGVFISVTTVPAAAAAVVALTTGDLTRAGQSAVQLVVNLAGIVLAGAVVLLVRTRRTGSMPRRPLADG